MPGPWCQMSFTCVLSSRKCFRFVGSCKIRALTGKTDDAALAFFLTPAHSAAAALMVSGRGAGARQGPGGGQAGARQGPGGHGGRVTALADHLFTVSFYNG